jgi:hypothetical protein
MSDEMPDVLYVDAYESRPNHRKYLAGEVETHGDTEYLSRFHVEREYVPKEQLPEEMQDCTIRFKECDIGHGWLTATNWIQHGCPTCQIEKLKAESVPRELVKEIKRLMAFDTDPSTILGYIDTAIRNQEADE